MKKLMHLLCISSLAIMPLFANDEEPQVSSEGQKKETSLDEVIKAKKTAEEIAEPTEEVAVAEPIEESILDDTIADEPKEEEEEKVSNNEVATLEEETSDTTKEEIEQKKEISNTEEVVG